MENRNNALHYKMYKSGKSIVYAGLATTAALAGLAFANVNATAVHADTVETTCPAPNAVSDAQKAANAANTAADAQRDAVVSAQDKVNELTQANEGLKQLSAAQQDYANAKSNANSATEQYNKVARPAEKEAQNAFEKATNTTNLSDAKSAATKASNDLATNQSKASSVQAEIKTLSDAVVTTSASANQAHENYVANSNAASSALADYNQAIEDGFASDSQKVQDLFTNYNSLKDLANATAVKSQKAHKEYQDALGKFNNRVKGKNGLQAKLDQLNSWIKYDQSVVDVANAYDKAYQNAKSLLNAKADAQVAMNNARALVNQIRKDYNIPTKAQIDAQKENVENAKGLLDLAKSNAAKNPQYVRATKDIPNHLAKLKQSVGDSTLTELVAARDLAKANKDSAKKAFDEAMKGTDSKLQQKLAKKLGAAEIALSNAQQKIQDLKDINRLETELDSLNNNASVKASKDDIANREKQLTEAQNKLTTMQDNFDAVNKLSEANAKLAAATELYNQLSKQAKDAQAKADALQKALDACKDQPSTPGDDNKPSQGEDNKPGSNAGNNSGSTNNSGTTRNGNSGVSGNHGATTNVNGSHGATVNVNGSHAASFAATKANYAAATAPEAKKSDSQSLPQTGNESSAAVVALGAVSAMFGLGLAAKKREF